MSTSPPDTPSATFAPSFQHRVERWVDACFGPELANDIPERNHRFLEEALELVQSLGCTRSEVLALVDYVYGRKAGEPRQEVGGVMVTLATLCTASGMDMQREAEIELQRIDTPAMIAKIQTKHAGKPKISASQGQ